MNRLGELPWLLCLQERVSLCSDQCHTSQLTTSQVSCYLSAHDLLHVRSLAVGKAGSLLAMPDLWVRQLRQFGNGSNLLWTGFGGSSLCSTALDSTFSVLSQHDLVLGILGLANSSTVRVETPLVTSPGLDGLVHGSAVWELVAGEPLFGTLGDAVLVDPDHVANPGAEMLGVFLVVRSDAVHVWVVSVQPVLDSLQLLGKVCQVLDTFVRQEVDGLTHLLLAIDRGCHLLTITIENSGLVGDGHGCWLWREGVHSVFGRWRVCNQTLGWRDGTGTTRGGL
jgi:hypothetical protein